MFVLPLDTPPIHPTTGAWTPHSSGLPLESGLRRHRSIRWEPLVPILDQEFGQNYQVESCL